MMTFRTRLLVTAAVLTVFPLSGCKKTRQIAAQATGAVGVTAPTYTDELHGAIDPGHLALLHSPDFSDIQPAISSFYDNRNFTLAWSKDGKPTKQATAMMEAFSNARQRGLEPEDYDASKWQGLVSDLGTDQGKANFDASMSISTARFLNAIHMGRTNPQAFSFGIDSSSKQLDLPTVLESQIIDASDVDSTLTGFEPNNAQYKALKDSLHHYLDLASQDHSDPLPDPGKSTVALSPGYPALQPLAQKLTLVGDLQAPSDTNAQPDLTALTDALKHFQSRHGLAQDGKLNAATVSALNIPITTRIQQIADSMERWRWLTDEYQHPAILVNLPEFELRTFNGDNEDFSKEEHHTPMIADHMKYLVFRPYWNLPVDIAKKDLVPHMEKNPGYLAEHHYETVNNKGEPEEASAERIAHGNVLVRQLPGTSNSLGLVKFMFPNKFNVYLHDTDAHALFSRVRRDYSHGCVRVQDPPKLADWLLRNNSQWDPEKIQDTMNDESVTNKSVSLGAPVPIVLFYGTAYVDNGEIHFFQDMYGYDKDMEDMLKKGAPYPQKPVVQRGEASV
jgi:murein L,D-transpeptidase YcbB/YkuD